MRRYWSSRAIRGLSRGAEDALVEGSDREEGVYLVDSRSSLFGEVIAPN